MSGIHWIKIPTAGRLAIMARPRAGDWLSEEIARWKNAVIDVVVSLLETQEVTELGLQREAEFCRSGGIEFISFPIPHRGVPVSESKTKELVSSIVAHVSAGRSVTAEPALAVRLSLQHVLSLWLALTLVQPFR